MNPETFLHNLHFDPDQSRSVDMVVDWDDAPLPYKLYRGLPVVPLCAEVPLRLAERTGSEPSEIPCLRTIGHFLWYAFGLTQLSQTAIALNCKDKAAAPGTFQSFRRFVPSGGGLYPSEVYLYLKLPDLPSGVYHYDVAHHRLVLVREGVFDGYLGKLLGGRCDLAECFGVVIASTMFWKNFYKYHDFAYRLQGLDCGVLLGQLLEVAKRFGFTSKVYYQFVDRAVNHLLGLSGQEESVFAVMPLSHRPVDAWGAYSGEASQNVTATELCRELPQMNHSHYVRSQRVKDYSQLLQMNEACRYDSTAAFSQRNACRAAVSDREEAVMLPDVPRLSYDFTEACLKRYSPEADFVLEDVDQEKLAALLSAATAAFVYQNDLDEHWSRARVSLYCCVYQVEGIEDGAYRYDSKTHTLRRIRRGDQRPTLQQGMSLDNINLFQVPLCLHVVGDRKHGKAAWGYRGYRIQQMEAGMLVQRLLLAASAMGLGGHPLLGFDVNTCDEMYRLVEDERTCLIQIPIGPHRQRPRLQGSMRS